MNGLLSQRTLSLCAPSPRYAQVRAHPLLAPLAEQLDAVGARLGTPNELPGDAELAQQMGHQLRNLICLVTLLQDVAAGPRPPLRELNLTNAPRGATAFV